MQTFARRAVSTATIKDLTAWPGASPVIITHALAASRCVNAKTRALVRITAAEMGYVANTATKTMRSQQSMLIGLVIPDIENRFCAFVAKAVSEVCNQNAFQLMLAVSDDVANVEERHIEELVSVRCAGIAIVATPEISARSLGLLGVRNVAQFNRRCPNLEADC